MKTRTIARLLAAIGLATAGLAQAAYSNLFVFGDSLSDSGNNALALGIDPAQVITGNTYIPTKPYGSGNYTNGTTWAQRFAGRTGLGSAPSLAGGSNYAFGGAQTSYEDPLTGGFPYSLTTQSNMFLQDSHGVAPDSALYVVAGGGNNARAALALIAGGADAKTTIQATAEAYAADIGSIVDKLQAAGAEHIIVWNTPDVGLAPATLAYGSAFSALATSLSSTMNLYLAGRLAFESADVKTFDLFGLQNKFVADPGAFGLSNVTDACGALTHCHPSQYLYWDGIHPTSKGHQLIANNMFALAVPEPSTVAMLLAGAFVVVAVARRRRTAA